MSEKKTTIQKQLDRAEAKARAKMLAGIDEWARISSARAEAYDRGELIATRRAVLAAVVPLREGAIVLPAEPARDAS